MPSYKRGPEKGHAGAKKRRPNQGRQEMRKITRTARRDEPAEPVAESDEASDLEPEQAAAAAPQFADGKAYDALLTLLKAEHKPQGVSAPKTAVVVEDEDIAGMNVEDANDEDDEDEQAEEDTEESSADPFDAHFTLVSDVALESKAKAMAETKRWPTTKATVPDLVYTTTTQSAPGESLGQVALEPKTQFSDYGVVKQRIKREYLEHHLDTLKPLEAHLLADMLSYKDVSYPAVTYKNTSYRKLYLTHILNHVFKTRDRVLKNNEKIRTYNDALKAGATKRTEEPELRDQGFTRPKVLILLPTRNAAYETVEQIIRLSGSDQQENRRKFKKQFHQEGGPPETKPADFREMFKGNSNDFFSIGLKFTRKAVKLYSSFYNSDILVASPIGLSMILEDPKQSKREYDFLSSIEILAIDQANQIEMQNWDHVGTVLKYINKIPKDFHGADFSRIRMWAINDQLKMLRQSLVFSEFLTPSVSSVVTRSENIAGKVRYRPTVTSQTCIMNSVGLKVKQIFQRFDAPDPQTNYESRYKFFINSVLPSITKQSSYDDGLLIYIPSYFDYVRVKSYMKSNTKFDFVSIDEYSSQSKVSRARHNFLAGRAKMMLYTERMHHFRRFDLSGVKNVLIYEAPSNPLFYKELLRFVGKSVFKSEADVDLSFVKTIYSKWDAAALERIVGNERAPILCNSVNELYEFR